MLVQQLSALAVHFLFTFVLSSNGSAATGRHSCMAGDGGLYNERGEVPRLGEAARRCDLEALREILSAGVDVDYPNSPDRRTALQLCCGKSHQYGVQGPPLADRIACVEFLLANGASPNAGAPGNPGQGTYSTNLTPLMNAAYHAQVEIVELLLSAGADVNVILDYFDEDEEDEEDDEKYFSALGWATSAYPGTDRARCNAVIEAMIRAGADANPPIWHGRTVIQRVIMDRRRRIWPVLLRAGAILPTGDVRRNGYRIYAHPAHPYLQKIETAGGLKAYEKAHRAKLLATFTPKFTHLVPEELVPIIVEFSFHVGFY